MFLKGYNLRHHHDDDGAADGDMGACNVAKATAMVCLFAVSFTLGTIPIKLNKWMKWETDAKSNKYVKLLLCFGGGVLFCTTFLHMLPEVGEGIEDLNLDTGGYEIHYAELLMCTGFFVMYFVEELIHNWLHRREAAQELKPIRKSLQIRRGDFVLEEKPHEHNHDHAHEHNHEHTHVVPMTGEDSFLKTIRGLLIVLALSVHELFEGLAVGLESSSQTVWYMFGAVSAHKFVIAFCIGVELVTSQMKNKLVFIYVFTFAVVSPMGIGIGMAITNTDQTSTQMVSVLLQGLASGTLLYVVFFEILQADRKSGLLSYFSILVGFVVMLIITILA